MRLGGIGRAVLCLGLLLAARPGHALPEWSREYRVTCQMCHSVPPRLNYFGLAFQANHFNWPSPRRPDRRQGVEGLPISAVVTTSLESSSTEHRTTANFRDLAIFVADGFHLGGQRPGGFKFNVLAATTDEDASPGNLDDGFVSLPIAGRRGQWALTFGNISPLSYQWDHADSLTHALPSVFDRELDEFSFTEHSPGVRIEFYDRRAQGTADGNYVEAEVPVEGKLALNSGARLDGPRGVFVHAFHRRGWTTLGTFGYAHAENHLGGLIGTCQISASLYLLGAAAIGRDAEGSTRRFSVEGEYLVGPRLAFTGRLEVLAGSQQDVAPVAAVTYYPLPVSFLRLTAEAVQRKGERTFTMFARGQF